MVSSRIYYLMSVSVQLDKINIGNHLYMTQPYFRILINMSITGGKKGDKINFVTPVRQDLF